MKPKKTLAGIVIGLSLTGLALSGCVEPNAEFTITEEGEFKYITEEEEVEEVKTPDQIEAERIEKINNAIQRVSGSIVYIDEDTLSYNYEY